jgi:hypothetical protein
MNTYLLAAVYITACAILSMNVGFNLARKRKGRAFLYFFVLLSIGASYGLFIGLTGN